jgi:photosystem II stability/assembly factor-like uncharacterized protein
MADWDGLRSGLEGSVTPPPLGALRERRKRRQQRRAIATTFAVVLVGSAGGIAALGRGTTGDHGTPVAAPTALSQVVNSDKLPPPNDYRDYVVTDVDFVTPATGWAIGLRCVGETCDVATWRSDDGGRTWSAPVEVAEDVPRVSFHTQDPKGGAVRSLRMVDERHGYAFNPDLYVTSDGARTWRRVPQRSKVASVSVADGTVWVTERGCADGVDCDLVIRAGEVGGPLGTLRIPETNGAAAVVRRAGATHGYVLAWDAPDAPHAAFLRTGDGGLTWSRGRMPCPDATAASLSAGAQRPLWVVCTTPKGRAAYQSDDHGTTWRALPPPPAEGVVADLVARSAGDAYLALQEPARLYVTADAGATWRPAEGTGRGYGYANLDVVDATHAWAMGDAGLLWRTTDGRHWERLALPPAAPRATGTPPPPPAVTGKDVSFTGLWFTGADTGWALGRRCPERRCSLVLRRTADGGRTWLPATAPARVFEDEPLVPGNVHSVVFADDARTGYLYDPGLYVTHDGGATWRDLAGHGHVRDVVVRDGAVWTLEYGGCASMDCFPYVQRADLGSDTFRRAFTDEDSPLGTAATLAVADGRTAYLMDASHDVRGTRPTLLATTDGGRTWDRRVAPCRGAFAREAAATGGTLWVLCGDEGGGGHEPHRTAQSTDGGRTWTERASRDGQGYVGELVAFTPRLAWRSDDGIASGIKVTRDGGLTWTAQVTPEDNDGSGGAYAFQMLDESHGVALYPGDRILRTTDGLTWQRMARP